MHRWRETQHGGLSLTRPLQFRGAHASTIGHLRFPDTSLAILPKLRKRRSVRAEDSDRKYSQALAPQQFLEIRIKRHQMLAQLHYGRCQPGVRNTVGLDLLLQAKMAQQRP